MRGYGAIEMTAIVIIVQERTRQQLHSEERLNLCCSSLTNDKREHSFLFGRDFEIFVAKLAALKELDFNVLSTALGHLRTKANKGLVTDWICNLTF